MALTADQLDESKSLVLLITITKGTTVLRFTDWPLPITVAAVTWIPQAGCSGKAIIFRTNGDVANSQISVGSYPGSLIAITDAVNGKYRGADITIEVCNPWLPENGKQTWLEGVIGPVEEDRSGLSTLINFTARGNLSRFKGLLEEKYGAACTLDLGEDRCRVPTFAADQTRNKAYVLKANAATVDKAGTGFATRVSSDGSGSPASYGNVYFECTTAGTTAGSAPTYNHTIGATTTDGTAVFTARDAFVRAFVVSAIADNGFDVTLTALPDTRAVDGWFTEGYAYIRSGLNPGLQIPIANWDHDSATFTSWDNLTLLVGPGDTGEIVAGCDHRRSTCFTKFDNIINFHGYGTFAPGRSMADAT